MKKNIKIWTLTILITIVLSVSINLMPTWTYPFVVTQLLVFWVYDGVERFYNKREK